MTDASWPWNAKAPRRAAYVTAALVSLALYLVVFGPRHMFGTSPYWDLPQDDQIQYLIGYRYFLHEPWHWPLFATHTMNVPLPESIAFTDSIPLWALLNKTVATICPPWGTFTIRAYLGIWYAVVYCLQGCLGLAILRRLGHRDWATAILVPPIVIAVPAFAIRYAHASLSAHFLILWALYLYLCTPALNPFPRRLRLAWLAELACAAWINPYHTAISFGLFVAAMLRTRNGRTLVTWIPAGVAAIGLAAWIAGYFSPAADVHMRGFGQAGTNLLSFVVPARSGLVGTATWIANVQPTSLAYEGWAYLGVGYLVLLALLLRELRVVGRAVQRHPFLFALVAASWLFALSDHVYFGSHLVLSYAYPRVLHWIPDQFRAPGRFVWPALYVLIIFLLHRGSTTLTHGWRRLGLPVLVIAQLIDARGAWQWPLSSTDHGRRDEVISLDAWRPLVFAHAAVTVLPSYVCALEGAPHVDQVSREIEFLASERALPINGVYPRRSPQNRPLVIV